ncbi:RNA-directed DNA polymerase, eukaryota, reverse transcriptase zinc-binding domain protein [Tanacetum coccineum]
MFYADDAIFVGQWSDGNITTLLHVLDCFYHASGLKINLRKSKIMGVNVDYSYVNQAAVKLGCQILDTPFMYLGTKVGGNMLRVQAWQEVVEKVKARLSKWKMNTLSIGGRLTLLKSVLGSIPIFHMSIFKVPSKILQLLESIRGRFFNGYEIGSNKASWVKWNNVMKDKKRGGLGVSSLYALNRGLMLKWFWKFFVHKDALWTKVIKAIHGVNGNVSSGGNYGGRSCWSSIVNEVQDGILKDIFLGCLLYRRVRRLLFGLNLGISIWLSLFVVGLGGAEQTQFIMLEDLVRSISLVPMNDRWVWNLESTGDFSVSSIRRKIDEMYLPNSSESTRWVKCVPIKVNILAWKIRCDGLPTRINLSRRGIDIHAISCPICDCGVESSEHLFFSCKTIQEIGKKVVRWWNINYVEVNSYEEWKTWLTSCRMASKLKQIFEGVWYSLWWHVWNYRNKLFFDAKTPLKLTIFDNVIFSSFHWCKARCKASFDWIEWLKNPYLISL